MQQITEGPRKSNRKTYDRGIPPRPGPPPPIGSSRQMDVWFSLPDYRRMLCLAEEVGDDLHALWCRHVIATIKLTDNGIMVFSPSGLPLGIRETRDGEAGLNIAQAVIEASGVSSE